MKRTVRLFLIILAGTAQVEAHAFLRDAEPAVGSTVQTSPKRGANPIYGKHRTSLQ